MQEEITTKKDVETTTEEGTVNVRVANLPDWFDEKGNLVMSKVGVFVTKMEDRGANTVVVEKVAVSRGISELMADDVVEMVETTAAHSPGA